MDPKDLKPHLTAKVYDWQFCLLENGTVMSKNDAKKLPWAERRGKEMDMTDSHLGAIRHLIANIRGMFPEKPVVASTAEPRKESVRAGTQAAV